MSKTVSKKIITLVSGMALELVFSFTGNAEEIKTGPSLDAQLNTAFHHLVQGDTTLAEKLLAEHSEVKGNNSQLNKLDIMLQIELENTDAAEYKLLGFESHFADDPDTFAFAADAWRDIGHQAGLFSKFGYYKKGVQAKLRAGEVAPDSAEYVALRAGASAHGSSYGADDALQKPLTDKVIALDKKWGYIAKLNYAQNTSDEQSGIAAVEQAINDFPNDFVVLERAAQYYWTIDNLTKAQQAFSLACENRPAQIWYWKIKWINACYQVAVFSQKHGLDAKMGVQALNRLLTDYKLPTKQNVDIAELLLDIAGGQNAQLAVQRLSYVMKHAKDKALVKRAKKRLAKLNIH